MDSYSFKTAFLRAIPFSLMMSGLAFAVSLLPLPQMITGEGWRSGIAALILTQLILAILFWNIIKTNRGLELRVQEISKMIRFDDLTGLATRNMFLDTLRRQRVDGGLLIADVDDFKAVNDQHGHEDGDRALVLLAGLLRRELGEHAIVGRLGGEEFGVYLPGLEHKQVEIIAEGLVAAAEAERDFKEQPWLYPQISIGATIRLEKEPIGHTLKRADRALQCAKSKGKNRLQFESPPQFLKLQGSSVQIGRFERADESDLLAANK